MANLNRFEELISLLEHNDKVIQGRVIQVEFLINQGRTSTNWVEKFHLAMIFGHLSHLSSHLEELLEILYQFLSDRNALDRNWSVTSRCILGKASPESVQDIIAQLRSIVPETSPAVAKRVQTAISVLNEEESIPKNWVKAERTKTLTM